MCGIRTCFWLTRGHCRAITFQRSTTQIKERLTSIKTSNIDNYVNSIKDKYYEIASITKPIRAISAHTLQDLYKICLKLKIDLKNDVRKKTKQQIYNEIKNMLLSDEI